MSTNNSGLRDEVRAELNPRQTEMERLGMRFGHPRTPDRPADSAKKAAWVDYCVALGADRTFLTQDTEHHDDETGKPVTEPGLSREQLIDLAGRLGG